MQKRGMTHEEARISGNRELAKAIRKAERRSYYHTGFLHGKSGRRLVTWSPDPEPSFWIADVGSDGELLSEFRPLSHEEYYEFNPEPPPPPPERKRRSKSAIIFTIMLTVMGIEALDQAVMWRLEAWHRRNDFFVDDAIRMATPIPKEYTDDQVMRSTISGVYVGRYQYHYSYYIREKEDILEVRVSGEAPHRRAPLWIFSIGLEDYGGTFPSRLVTETITLKSAQHTQIEAQEGN